MPWSAGAVLTAAQLNLYAPQAFTAFTPVMDGTGVTQGNATMTGGYIQYGKLCHFWAQAVLGTTTVIGSGLQVSLPSGVNAAATARTPALYARFTDTGTNIYLALPYLSTVTRLSLAVPGTNGAAVSTSATVPFTWASGDVINVGGTYEVA